MEVWVVTIDDAENPLLAADAVLGVFATEQAAMTFAEGPEAQPTIEQAGGWADPDGGFEVEASGTWHASLRGGGEITITKHEVQ